MRKHVIAGALLGAFILLAVVPLALAASDPAPVTVTSTPGATWMFKLKGTIPGAKNHEMSYADFAGFAKAHSATWTDSTDPANPLTYSGVDLKTLVGLIDDKNGKTFNEALAASGYTVRVIGVDGFSADFASDVVAAKNIVVASKVATGTGPSLALPFGTAKFKSSSGKPSFSPSWPIKLVGSDLTGGSQKIGGISLIVLLPKTARTTLDRASDPAPVTVTSTPGATWMFKLKGTIPGAKNHEMSYADFAGFAKAHSATWTDSTDPANPLTYSGVDLKTLVGLIDDKNGKTFNEALAASGYTVRVIGVDGFSADFASDVVAAKNIVVASKVATGTGPSLALPFGTAKFKSSSGKPSFSPSWPIKLVGSDLTGGSQKIGGISLIVLLPKTN